MTGQAVRGQFELRDEALLWTVREIEDVNLARVKALLDDGLSIRDIADETGISRSTVGRLKKQIEAVGRGATSMWQRELGTVTQKPCPVSQRPGSSVPRVCPTLPIMNISALKLVPTVQTLVPWDVGQAPNGPITALTMHS